MCKRPRCKGGRVPNTPACLPHLSISMRAYAAMDSPPCCSLARDTRRTARYRLSTWRCRARSERRGAAGWTCAGPHQRCGRRWQRWRRRSAVLVQCLGVPLHPGHPDRWGSRRRRTCRPESLGPRAAAMSTAAGCRAGAGCWVCAGRSRELANSDTDDSGEHGRQASGSLSFFACGAVSNSRNAASGSSCRLSPCSHLSLFVSSFVSAAEAPAAAHRRHEDSKNCRGGPLRASCPFLAIRRCLGLVPTACGRPKPCSPPLASLVQDIYEDFKQRRSGLLLALVDGACWLRARGTAARRGLGEAGNQ